jgi:6-phospho-beta-glucosidase
VSPSRIAVIGGGSAYLPGVVKGMIHRAKDLAGSEVVLYDTDPEACDVIRRLAGRMFEAAGVDLVVRSEATLAGALSDVGFVFTTFRPGGMAGRAADERIPLRHGIVGQETAGPGGFLMACRSVPVLLEIASLLERRSPGAWIVNYTNPTNIVTDAVLRFGSGRIVGLCDQHVGDLETWRRMLSLGAGRLEADWVGLNHATFARDVRLGGVQVEDLAARVARLDPDAMATVDDRRLVRIAQTLEVLPNSYARYYFFHDEIAAELAGRATTRGEELAAALPSYYAAYDEAARAAVPEPAKSRGGDGHGEVAVDTICAIAGDEERRLIVNTRNGSALTDLPAEAVVEVPCLVGRSGPKPLAMGTVPRPVSGLVAAIHAYEWLAAEAAATGSRRLALAALALHPFVRSVEVAERILDEGLAHHAAALPQFRAGG